MRRAIWALAAGLRPGQAQGQFLVATAHAVADQPDRGLAEGQRLALLAEARPVDFDWAFAAVGSDGRDGPGEAAAIRAGGIDPAAALARNDSTPALAAGDALVVTGATGTNVADLAVLARG